MIATIPDIRETLAGLGRALEISEASDWFTNREKQFFRQAGHEQTITQAKHALDNVGDALRALVTSVKMAETMSRQRKGAFGLDDPSVPVEERLRQVKMMIDGANSDANRIRSMTSELERMWGVR